MRTLVNSMDEKFLVEAAQVDPDRFAQLYEANFDRVFGYLLRRVKERAVAEDLTAEVFRQALTQIHRFEWRGLPFAAWLLRIAANRLNDHWRASGIEREVPFEQQPEAGEQPNIERATLLIQLLESLPEDQKLVVTRRFLDERSIREIAGEMGRSEGAIKQLQFRALQTMREKLRTNHE